MLSIMADDASWHLVQLEKYEAAGLRHALTLDRASGTDAGLVL